MRPLVVLIPALGLFSTAQAAPMPPDPDEPYLTSMSSPREVQTPPRDKNDIRDAQRALNRVGFHLKVNGVAGPDTLDAIRRFQAKHELVQTGSLDHETMTALRATKLRVERAGESPEHF